MCGTLSAAGGFTLFYSLVSLLLSFFILMWSCVLDWRVHQIVTRTQHQTEKGNNSNAAATTQSQPRIQFSPFLYTLTALQFVSELGLLLIWSFGGHLALQSNIYVPYAQWKLDTSWFMILICAIMNLPQQWSQQKQPSSTTTAEDGGGDSQQHVG